MSSGPRGAGTRGRRWVGALGAAGFVAASAVVLPTGSPALAAGPHVVSVGRTAFSPSRVSIPPGEQVEFRDDAGVPVTLTYGRGWPGPPSEQLQPGASSAPRTLAQPGTYGVHAADPAGVGLVSADGSVVVTAPASSPPPATRSPAPAPASHPTPRPSARPSSRPAPSATPSQPPPAAPGPVPTGAQPVAPAPAPPAPAPPVALPPVPAATAAPTPTSGVPAPPLAQPAVSGAPSASASPTLTTLRQDHPARRLGLPAAVAVVLLVGLVTALLRVVRALGVRRP